MSDYTAIWSINVDADSPIDAALQAKELANNIDFNSDSPNVFCILPGVHNPAIAKATTIDLGNTELDSSGDSGNNDGDNADSNNVTVDPSDAAATTRTTKTRRVLVTETITYDIFIDTATLDAAGVDPSSSDTDEVDTFIADITSTLDTGNTSFSIEDCQREITWLD